MPVARLREEVGNREYIEWQVYFGRKAQQNELARARARWDAQGR